MSTAQKFETEANVASYVRTIEEATSALIEVASDLTALGHDGFGLTDAQRDKIGRVLAGVPHAVECINAAMR